QHGLNFVGAERLHCHLKCFAPNHSCDSVYRRASRQGAQSGILNSLLLLVLAMRNLGLALYILAAIGTVTSTIFLGLVFLAVSRFRRGLPRKLQAVSEVPKSALPFVSVMKPIHGLEPRLKETLRSFFQQDYPKYELIC